MHYIGLYAPDSMNKSALDQELDYKKNTYENR